MKFLSKRFVRIPFPPALILFVMISCLISAKASAIDTDCNGPKTEAFITTPEASILAITSLDPGCGTSGNPIHLCIGASDKLMQARILAQVMVDKAIARITFTEEIVPNCGFRRIVEIR